MATDKIFDSHFHLLFKHFVTTNVQLDEDLRVNGIAQVMDEIFGGLFDSQSSPRQVSKSPLFVGVTSILAVEHAFANKVLSVMNIDLSGILPLDRDLFSETKQGKRTYYDEFRRQVKFYIDVAPKLAVSPYNIEFISRDNAAQFGNTFQEIEAALKSGNKRYLAFSIEGGHNLSNVPIRSQTQRSLNPELQLKEIQSRNDIDFMSMNLCHLSHIPEQTLGGFAQGLNKTAQIAFKSDDFMPKTGLGLTEPGKRVIRQALTHPDKPVLIDVKHMSTYTRFHYYRYREKLIEEHPDVERLPVISSHTGFTFISLNEYLSGKKFTAEKRTDSGGIETCEIAPENRLIGKTNDRKNVNLYGNPWTIGLFDEEIIEIMRSGGIIGISMDQRVLGASKMWKDGTNRPRYYEKEYIAAPEWQKLFMEGKLPSAEEGLFEKILRAPTRAERHIMLFCIHLVYAARIGYEALPWMDGTSPWDHLCIGSDFDGLINPLNGFDNIMDMEKMGSQLRQYLPVADKFLEADNTKALKYNPDGSVSTAFLEKVLEDVLFNNGVRFVARFLKNWR